jgi:gamma-glutamyltranspeptidase/glutathione hydrolase
MHAKIESIRLALADTATYLADPAHSPVPVDDMLSAEYLRERATLVSADHRMGRAVAGQPKPRSCPGDDTVYFSVVDAEGNGCSYINSNFMGFGTGIVPKGCGFSLQNRGRGFVLDEGHANRFAPGKRPYHTIMPGLITDARGGGLDAVFGIMGGMMQPQAHLQVATGMILAGLDPQSALDAPRFLVQDGNPDGNVLVEDSMDPRLVNGLRELGHEVSTVSGPARAVFGLGQIIAAVDGSWWSGSDARGDGHAAGF